ncbi:MAG: phosphotransferase, partial [Bacteroidota bacterium]
AEKWLYPIAPYATQQWILELKNWFHKHREELEHWPARRCLIHGDLGTQHLIFDPTAGLVKGVIDFGFAGIGDPAIDLAAVISQLGESQLQKMKPWYPELDDLLFRARLWSLSTPLWWAIQGIRTGDRSWLLAGLHTARDIRLE